MIETVVAISLILLSVAWPVKWAFSLSLATSYSLFYYLFVDIATIMFVILFLRIALKKGITQALNNRLFQNHALLVGLSVLTLLWATQVDVGISIVFAQIKVLIIAIVSLQLIEEKRDLKFVIYGTVAGAFYICISLVGWKFGLFGVSSSEYQANIDQNGRLLIQYFFPGRNAPINSNTWASLAALSSILGAAYYFYIVPNPKKTLKIIILGLVFLVFVITLDFGSRGGLLAIVSGVVLLFKAIPPKTFYTYGIGLFLLFYTGSLTVDFVSQLLPEGNEVLQSRLDESAEYEDPRIQIWLTGLNMAMNNFVIGVGIGNEGVRFKEYMVYDFQNTRMALHNSFLTHFAELGIFGLILFVRGMYLWQKPFIFRRSTKVLLVVVSMNILLNAFAHSFELENYFIAIIYSIHAYFLLEMKEAKNIQVKAFNDINLN
jgi:hypothetical protein